MPNKVQLKKSSVVARVPTTTDLDYGELAINYADEKLYFKNTANEIKAFSVSTGSASTGIDFESYVATAAQTVFAVTYTVPNVIVSVNGALLNPSDYTATNGTSITLATACAAGDVVALQGFTSLSVGYGLPAQTGNSGKYLSTDGSNVSWQTVSGGGGGGGGVRNRLINGAFAIDQRNCSASRSIVAGAALLYTVDRWYAYCTGANVTGQQVAGAVANTYNYRFTGAGSVTGIGFGQRIEATNCADLAGTTAMLSVNLSNTLLSTVTWTAYYANTTDTFGTLASPSRTQIATGTFSVTSTLTRYNAQISIPIAATTGIEIVLSVGAQTSGTWTIGSVQLESGTAATTYEYRLTDQELSMCQRYFEKSYDLLTTPGTVTQNGSKGTSVNNTGYGITPCYFSTTKRVPPTVTTYSPGTGAAGFARNISGTQVDWASTATQIGATGVNIQVGPQFANAFFLSHFTADSEL